MIKPENAITTPKNDIRTPKNYAVTEEHNESRVKTEITTK